MDDDADSKISQRAHSNHTVGEFKDELEINSDRSERTKCLHQHKSNVKSTDEPEVSESITEKNFLEVSNSSNEKCDLQIDYLQAISPPENFNSDSNVNSTEQSSKEGIISNDKQYLHQELLEKEAKQCEIEKLMEKFKQEMIQVKNENKDLQSDVHISKMLADERKENNIKLKKRLKELTFEQEAKDKTIIERTKKMSRLKHDLKESREREEKLKEEKKLLLSELDQLALLKRKIQQLESELSEAKHKIKVKKTKMKFLQKKVEDLEYQEETSDAIMAIIPDMRKKIDQLREENKLLAYENENVRRKLEAQERARELDETKRKENTNRFLDMHQKLEECISFMRRSLELPIIRAKVGEHLLNEHLRYSLGKLPEKQKEKEIKERKAKDEISCRLKGFQDKINWQESCSRTFAKDCRDNYVIKSDDNENCSKTELNNTKNREHTKDAEDTIQYLQCLKQHDSEEMKELKRIGYSGKNDYQETSYETGESMCKSPDSPTVFLTEAPEQNQPPNNSSDADVSLDMVVKTMEKSELLLKEISSFVDKMSPAREEKQTKKQNGEMKKEEMKCIDYKPYWKTQEPDTTRERKLKRGQLIKHSEDDFIEGPFASNELTSKERSNNGHSNSSSSDNSKNYNMNNRASNKRSSNSIKSRNPQTYSRYVEHNKVRHGCDSENLSTNPLDRKLDLMKRIQRQSRYGVYATYGGTESKSYSNSEKKIKNV